MSSYPLYQTLSGGNKKIPTPTPTQLAKLVSDLVDGGEESERLQAIVMLIVEHYRVTENLEPKEIGLLVSSADGLTIDFKDAPLELRKILGRFLQPDE